MQHQFFAAYLIPLTDRLSDSFNGPQQSFLCVTNNQKLLRMKKYTTDMVKLLSILLVTPVLVMAYTKIEKAISPVATEKSQVGVAGITPVSIGLMNTGTDTDITTSKDDNDYILVKSPTGEPALSEKDIVQAGAASNRFALVSQ
jgi:hypothetical protein